MDRRERKRDGSPRPLYAFTFRGGGLRERYYLWVQRRFAEQIRSRGVLRTIGWRWECVTRVEMMMRVVIVGGVIWDGSCG